MANSNVRRVVITGMGLISPLGNSPEKLWDALSHGRSGIARLMSLPAEVYTCPFGGEARGFTGHIDDFGTLSNELKKSIRKGLKLMCREIEMGVAAAQLALQNAGITSGVNDPDRTGVSFGSDYIMTPPAEFIDAVHACNSAPQHFDFDRWAPAGMPKIAPLWLLKYLPNMPASHIAIYNDFRGPSNSITLREASSHLAIGEACATIMRDHADIVIAGATGTRIHPVRTIHVTLQEQIAEGTVAEKLMRPFDRNRTGMVLGEGAAAVIVEELEHARRRGATILGEIVGFGSSACISPRGIADIRTAIRNAVAQTFRREKLTPDEIGHIHAHGLSTTKADAEEAAAINDLFGGRRVPVPITAAKSYFGNLGAGSGGAELIASVLALNAGRLFPILNYETPDPLCPLNVVSNFDTSPGDSFVCVSVTPQGQSSALAVRKFQG